MSVLHYIDLLPFRESSYSRDECDDYICRLTMRGSLGIDNAHETAVLVKAMIQGGMRRFILNMENLTYVDSTGIGVIIRIKKNLLAANGDLVLYNVPPKVIEVFDLVNLKEFIRIFYSEQKALEFLRSSCLP